MILVAVGNATQHFARLLDALEDVSKSGDLGSEDVVVQLGSNPPREEMPWRQEAVLPHEEFRRLVADARVVVCHAGAGTLLDVLSAGKTPVVMPRRRDRNEIIDDHQVELAQAFERERRVVVADSSASLRAALRNGGEATMGSTVRSAGGERLRQLVSDVFNQFCAESAKHTNKPTDGDTGTPHKTKT